MADKSFFWFKHRSGKERLAGYPDGMDSQALNVLLSRESTVACFGPYSEEELPKTFDACNQDKRIK